MADATPPPDPGNQVEKRLGDQTGLIAVGADGVKITNADQAYRIAQLAHRSKAYKLESPEVGCMIILEGLALGMSALASLKNIKIVAGTPTLCGDGPLALVRKSKELEYIKEWREGALVTENGVNDGDMIAYCTVRRKGEEDRTFTFSIADAKRAKLWMKKGRDGAPTPWVFYPERMLTMRARSLAMRDVFGDTLSGMGIAEELEYIETTAEEVQPETQPEAQAPAPASKLEAAKAALARKAKAASPPAPDPEPERQEDAITTEAQEVVDAGEEADPDFADPESQEVPEVETPTATPRKRGTQTPIW